MLPHWRLPAGVSRNLWESLHDPEIARQYDARLTATPLLDLDQRFVLEHCRPPGRILDLGCGTGRLSLALAEQGYRPVAVDLSSEMLKVLGEKAGARGVAIPRVQANLVELGCFADNCFDHAACLFSTLGLIEGGANRGRFMVHVGRIVKPGGVFIVHVHNRRFHWHTRAGRRLLLRNLFRSWRGHETAGDFLMPPTEGLGAITMHLFTKAELLYLLRQARFDIVEVRPVAAQSAAPLRWPRCLSSWRAYGFLVAARKR